MCRCGSARLGPKRRGKAATQIHNFNLHPPRIDIFFLCVHHANRPHPLHFHIMPSEQSTTPQREGSFAKSMDIAEFKQLSITTLHGTHRELLTPAINRVVSTDTAEIT
jgi:hypothetical protein